MEKIRLKKSDKTMGIEYIPISAILGLEKNFKNHDVEGIARSIKKFGLIDPIGVDQLTRENFDGNGTIQALEHLRVSDQSPPANVIERKGQWFVPVLTGVAFESETDRVAAAAALNRLNELGGYDRDKQAEILEFLRDAEMIEDSGFSDDDLDQLLAEIRGAVPPPEENGQKVSEIISAAKKLKKKWKTKIGQLWQLGNHKIYCGDSFQTDTFFQLKDEQPQMAFIDPPYNVGKDYEGEDLNEKEFVKFHQGWLDNLFGIMPATGAVYISFGNKFFFEFADILRKHINNPRLIVWYKPDQHGVGGGDFFYNYEAIFYGTKSGKFSVRSYDGEARDVWIINKAMESGGGFEHPTVKPVAVPSAAILTSSKPDDLILDCFLGSGSTLIACEGLDRRCFGIEKAPEYIAVTLERFFSLTGTKPKLIK